MWPDDACSRRSQRRGLLGRDLSVPHPDSLRDAWALLYDDPSYVAASDRVLEAWMATGQVDAVKEAAAALKESVRPTNAPIALGDARLWSARLSHADCDVKGAVTEARAALIHFRSTFAAWWVAQSLDLLTALGEATTQERAERVVIGARLGYAPPD